MASGSNASGRNASSDSSSSSVGSNASSDISAASVGSTKVVKPGPSCRGLRRHPPMLRMVLEALQARERHQGTSVAAIKLFIVQKYPTVDLIRLKYLLKQALAKGIHRGLLVRPLNSKAKGATGSFKLVPQRKRKTQLRKTSTVMALSKPGGKGSKQPSEAKKEPPNPGQVEKVPKKPDEAKKAPPRPGPAKGKALKMGSEAKAAKLGETRKGYPKPDKASGAAGLSGKAEAKDAEVHGKTKARSKSSKAPATKGKNRATAQTQKKMAATAKAPKEAAAPGPGEEPKAKAAAPPKGKGGSGSKTAPACLGSKMEAPKGSSRPGLPSKSLSSKGPSKKSEAGS